MESKFVVTVTDNNYKLEVEESKLPVLIDFWAEWCGPCRALGPVLEKVAEARQGKVKVCKVNVEENPTLAAQFNIRSIPYLAFMVNGKQVDSLQGNQPEKKLLEVIDKLA